MKQYIGYLLCLLSLFLSGCILPATRNAANLQAGLYETKVEAFVIRSHGGRLALALPDSEFHGLKVHRGAPSIAQWQKNQSDYPHVITGLPSGTRFLLKDVRVIRGYALGFGFGSRKDELADIVEPEFRDIEVGDFLMEMDAGIGPNAKYIRGPIKNEK